jgi:outer membrane protein assembly factor BamA
VQVQVEERAPRSVSLSLGYGTEDKVRAQASWQHRNLFGSARVFQIAAKYSALVYGVDATLEQRRWLEPLLDLELRTSARRETPPAYEANRYGGGVTLRRPLWPDWTGRAGYGLEWNTGVKLRSNEEDVDLPESTRLSTFEFGLRRTTLDDPLEPRRGTWLDLALEPSARVIGSEVDYVKASVEARAYLPVPWSVLAFRVRAGTLEPLGSTGKDDIPAFKRFYAGGSTSVRGYKYQKLPPLDDKNEPLGGLTRVEGSAELRFPIWWRISGVGFVDAGQLALDPTSLDPDDFFYSAGGGLRVRTPVGPVRFDIGFPLNRPSGTAPYRFYFSVGHAF